MGRGRPIPSDEAPRCLGACPSSRCCYGNFLAKQSDRDLSTSLPSRDSQQPRLHPSLEDPSARPSLQGGGERPLHAGNSSAASRFLAPPTPDHGSGLPSAWPLFGLGWGSEMEPAWFERHLSSIPF